jgi:hypothetical protein
MITKVRRIPRVSVPVLALALTYVAVAPSAMADTIYPDHKITGASFDAGSDGWTEFSNSTLLLGLLDSTNPDVCNTQTAHAAGIGSPAGSLEQSYDGSAGGRVPLVFQATATARSSAFTIGPNSNGATGAMSFAFDRRADLRAGLLFSVRARYTFTLQDLTSGTSLELYDEELGSADDVFAGVLRTKLPNAVPGHTYGIELQTVFRCSILCGGLKASIANFDNLRLRVADGTTSFGAPTAVTQDATNISDNATTLNSRIDPEGLETQVFSSTGSATRSTSRPAG